MVFRSSGQVNSNYSNITFNEDDGVYLTGNNFSNIKNSIIWGNDVVNYTPNRGQALVLHLLLILPSRVVVLMVLLGGQYYYGDGSIDDDPVFADAEQTHE